MDKEILREIIIRSIVHIFLSMFVALISLVTIAYLFDPDSVLAFFKN